MKEIILQIASVGFQSVFGCATLGSNHVQKQVQPHELPFSQL
jgi:hypothetical protein